MAHFRAFLHVFSARQHIATACRPMLSALYAIARPSVYVTRVDHTKMVEVRIMKFLPYGSPMPLVFVR